MDWADEKAREWLNLDWASAEWDDGSAQASLAALLREVAEAFKAGASDATAKVVLAEVRRVVEEVQGGVPQAWWVKDEILKRLEKL
jgi:hypothetical protein